MDPLAHSLFGAALARTRLGRATSWAVPVAVAAANAPDIDVFAYAAGGDTALWIRRGWTHGPLGLALLALATVALLSGARRWIVRDGAEALDTRRLALIATLAVISHPLLDWLNTYGVRLLMPFDRRWFYGDALFIVDPWMWLLLGGSVYLCHRPRRGAGATWIVLAVATTALLVLAADPLAGKLIWSAGIVAVAVARRRWWRRLPAPPKVAEALLAVFVIYALGMAGTSRRAASIVRAEWQRSGGGPIQALMVSPLPLTPLRREVVLATDTSIHVGSFDWRASPHVELDEATRRPARGDALGRQALGDPCIRGFANWARFPYVETTAGPEESTRTVHLIDARYARRAGPGFGAATVTVPRDGATADPADP